MILCCTFHRQRDKAKIDLLKVEGRRQTKGLTLVDVNTNGAASKLKCCVHGFINVITGGLQTTRAALHQLKWHITCVSMLKSGNEIFFTLFWSLQTPETIV